MGAGIHTRVPTGYSGGNGSVEPNPNLGRNEKSHKVYVLFSPDTPPSSIIINWRHGSLLGFPIRSVYVTLMELSMVSQIVAVDDVVGGFPTAVSILSVVFRRQYYFLRVEGIRRAAGAAWSRWRHCFDELGQVLGQYAETLMGTPPEKTTLVRDDFCVDLGLLVRVVQDQDRGDAVVGRD